MALDIRFCPVLEGQTAKRFIERADKAKKRSVPFREQMEIQKDIISKYNEVTN